MLGIVPTLEGSIYLRRARNIQQDIHMSRMNLFNCRLPFCYRTKMVILEVRMVRTLPLGRRQKITELDYQDRKVQRLILVSAKPIKSENVHTEY
jgi:hypothetical protein